MLDDITTTIKAQLYERATSPLLGSFIISWCVINYKVLLIIFSSLNAPEKITYISMNLFASANDYLIKGALAPLLTALALILIYPYPAAWIYRISKNHQKKLKSIRQLIDDETPLTVQESRTLRLESIQQQIKLESEIERYTQENRSLKSIIENHEPAYTDLKNSGAQAAREKNEALARLSEEEQKTQRLDQLLEQVIKSRKDHPDSKLDIESLKKQIFTNTSVHMSMQANKVRDEIKRSIEDYISDIKPFGNIKSTVEITNDRLYTSHQTPNGLEIKDWGKINANDSASSALKIMGEMRNHRDNKGG